jgi:hypothetical protein
MGDQRKEGAMARKKPEREVKEELERRLKEIELLKEQAQQQGLAFSAPTKEQLEKKIRGENSNSPYIYSLFFDSIRPRGSTGVSKAWIANPDPDYHNFMFVSLFWGVANLLDNIADGLSGRDTHWPCLSSQPFHLAPGATSTQSFTWVVPNTVQPSTYLGNFVVWRSPLHDKGTYFDRGMFYTAVS